MSKNAINMVWRWTSPATLSSVEEMMPVSTGRTSALFLGHTRKPSFRHQWLPRTWSWDHFELTHGCQCKLTRDRPSALPSGDGAKISLIHVSFANLQLQFSGTYRMLLQHPLQPLWKSDVGQRERFLAHVPRSPRCGRQTAYLSGGHLQRIGVHFWNWNTTQMSSINLGRTLRKLLAAFRTFQHQFSPDRNRNRCTHAAKLSPPSWDATHTASRCSQRGFHRANAGRYRLPVLQVHLQRVATCPALLPLRCVS